MSRYPAADQLGNLSKERLEMESIVGRFHLWVWRYSTRVGRPNNIKNKYAKTGFLLLGKREARNTLLSMVSSALADDFVNEQVSLVPQVLSCQARQNRTKKFFSAGES